VPLGAVLELIIIDKGKIKWLFCDWCFFRE
jgi:hypothetical protein